MSTANENESAKDDSGKNKKSVLSQGERTNRQLTGRGHEEQSQLSHLISQRYLEPNGVQSAVPTPNQTIIQSDISKAEGVGPFQMANDRKRLPPPVADP